MCVCSHVHVSKMNKTSSSLSVSTYIPLSLFLFPQLSTSLTSLPFLLSPTADQWGVQHISSSHHEPKAAAWSLEKHLAIQWHCMCRILLYCACINHCLIIIHLAYFCLNGASHDLCMCISSQMHSFANWPEHIQSKQVCWVLKKTLCKNKYLLCRCNTKVWPSTSAQNVLFPVSLSNFGQCSEKFGLQRLTFSSGDPNTWYKSWLLIHIQRSWLAPLRQKYARGIMIR